MIIAQNKCRLNTLPHKLGLRGAPKNIGASRFALYDSGFDSGIPDFGSVRTLLCAFKTTMVGVENNLSFEASDSK